MKTVKFHPRKRAVKGMKPATVTQEQVDLAVSKLLNDSHEGPNGPLPVFTQSQRLLILSTLEMVLRQHDVDRWCSIDSVISDARREMGF